MTKIIPGSIQLLPIVEVTATGYLVGFSNDLAFMRKGEVKRGTEPGQDVEVFTFYNEERELEATTRLPTIQVGQVGCFRVGNSNELGAFIHIGTRRDILIPAKEQVESLEEGRMTLVILLEDPEGKRLYASTKLNRHLRNKDVPYQRGDEVSLTIAEKIEIGRRVVIDGKYIGALFRQEMTDKVRLGEKVKGFIRKVEGTDIVVSMQREGMDLLDDSKEKIMSYLNQNGGYVRLNDDTDAEEIKLRLHMSKKAFKKAAGMLYKEGKVLLTKVGIKINKTGVVPKEWERNKIFSESPLEEDVKVEREEFRAPKRSPRDQEERPKRDYSKTNTNSRDTEARPPRDQEERPKRDYSKPNTSSRDTETRPLREKSDEPKKEYPPRTERSSERSSDDAPKTPVKKQLTFKGKK